MTVCVVIVSDIVCVIVCVIVILCVLLFDISENFSGSLYVVFFN